MSKNYDFHFFYIAIPDDKSDLYSACCYDRKGNKIKTIDAVGEKEITENFCKFLNQGEVHPCHFEDIFDDYFG